MSLARGIYKKAHGYDVRATARGITRFKGFPLDTKLSTMKNWQEAERATIRRTHPKVSRGTFQADVQTYFRQPLDLTPKTRQQREQMLNWWVEQIGPTKRRSAITVADVQAGMDALTTGPGSRRHYRSALILLWEKLDGKQAWCPAKEVDAPAPKRGVVRAISQSDIAAIVRAMPEPLDAMSARILVMMQTGLPPGMLAKLTADHVDFDRSTVTVPPREKGSGVDGRVLPVTAQALMALAAWRDTGADTPFDEGAAYRYFRRLCRAAGVTPRRLYDLRHTFLTEAMTTLNGNIKAVQGLALHANSATTEIYTRGAASPLLARAVLDLDQSCRNSTKH